jgi:hypothetical protein
MKKIKLIMIASAALAISLLWQNAVVAQANLNGEATLSYLQFNHIGNRSFARELNDVYSGFNLQNFSAFGDLNKHTRYSLNLYDIGFDGRRAAMNLTDINLFKLKFDYRQSRLLYGEGTSPKNSRKAYSGYFELKPIDMLSAFVDYQGYKNEGDRIVADTFGTGLFGNKYDRNSSSIKGGLIGSTKSCHLEAAYGQRTYDDDNNLLDSKTNFASVDFLCRRFSKLKWTAHYDYAQKKLDSTGTELKDNMLGLTALYRPLDRLTLLPMFSYRTVNGEQAAKFSSIRFGIDVEFVTAYGTTLNGGIGYENRKTTNDEDVKSNLIYYSIGGRTRLNRFLAAKVVYGGENRDNPKMLLITGAQDKTRVLAELEMTASKSTGMKIGYKMNNRENSDINTKARAGSFYGTFNTRYQDKAEFGIQGNITRVKYDWNSQQLKYRYNSVTGSFAYNLSSELTLSTSLTYFIFRDDVRQDKVDATIRATCQFMSRAKFGISYRRYEFDNTLLEPARFRADLAKAELTIDFGTNKQ